MCRNCQVGLQLAIVLLAIQGVSAQAPPNIVLIYADDLGYGDLSIQNPEAKLATPHLDQCAREGMRFTDAHSSSGVCSSSRYALLTGRYHWRKFHGIVHSFGPPALAPEEWTMAEMLQARGYRTACIGKWHLGWNWRDIHRAEITPWIDTPQRDVSYPPEAFDWTRPVSGGPLSHGFAEYFGDDVPNFPPYAWFRNDRLASIPSLPLTVIGRPAEGNWEARPGPMTPGWNFSAVLPAMAAEAKRFLIESEQHQQPFFLYFPLTSPHAPIVPDTPFQNQSAAGPYGDFVQQTDAIVGDILQTLHSLDIADNTLLIFTSDNGPERYAYERLRHYRHASSGPLRGVKRDLYEGGHRVPFLVRWPAQIPANTVCDALMGQIDVMATLAAVVGCELPAQAAPDSLNFYDTWTRQAPGPRDTLVHNTQAEHYAIRHREWVLIAAPTGAHSEVPAWFQQERGYVDNDLPVELYNLAEDLTQKNDVAEQYPAIVQAMQDRLAALRSQPSTRP